MIWVGVIGIIVNSLTAWMFMSGRKNDLNIRGAFLHMVADAGITLGVVIVELIIIRTGWLWLDPLVSLVIVAIFVVGTIQLARDGTNMALDCVPQGIEIAKIKEYLAGLKGVTEVHDLHVWSMSTTENALTVHLVRPGMEINDHFLSEVTRTLHDKFDINHPTIQIEAGDPSVPCRLAPDHIG